MSARSRLPSSGWAPMPSGLYRDPRYRRLGLAAARIHSDAHLFSNDMETDGLVTLDDVRMLAAAARIPEEHIADSLSALVASGLWRKEKAAYVLTDFLGLDHVVRELHREDWRKQKAADRARANVPGHVPGHSAGQNQDSPTVEKEKEKEKEKGEAKGEGVSRRVGGFLTNPLLPLSSPPARQPDVAVNGSRASLTPGRRVSIDEVADVLRRKGESMTSAEIAEELHADPKSVSGLLGHNTDTGQRMFRRAFETRKDAKFLERVYRLREEQL